MMNKHQGMAECFKCIIGFDRSFAKHKHYLPGSHSMQTNFTYTSANRTIQTGLFRICPSIFGFSVQKGAGSKKGQQQSMQLSN